MKFGKTTLPILSLIDAITPLKESYSNLNFDPKLRNSWRPDGPKLEYELVVVDDLEVPNTVEDLLENINNTARVLWRSFTVYDNHCPDNVKVDIPGITMFGKTARRRARIVAPWDLECPRCNIDLELKTNEKKNR